MDPDPVLPLIIQRLEDIVGSRSAHHQEEGQPPNARSEQAVERPSSKSSDQKDANKEDETRKEEETPGKEMPAQETTEEEEDGMGDIDDFQFFSYRPLCNHILEGDWPKTKTFLDEHPRAKTCHITVFGETAFHVAVKADVSNEFVLYLVDLLPNDCQFDMVDFERRTALHYAAIVGNIDAAKILVTKNPNLTQMLDGEGATPLLLAAKFAHEDIALYLLVKTMEIAKFAKLRPIKPDSTTPDPFKGEVGAKLLNSLILANCYDLAIIVVKNYEDLAYQTDRNCDGALEILAQNPRAFWSGTDLGFFERKLYKYISVEKNTVTQRRRDVENPDASSPQYITEPPTHIEYLKRIYKTKLMNKQAEELAHMLCVAAAKSMEGTGIMINAFSIAVREGISEIISEINKAVPDSLAFPDNKHRFMPHIAVENRKEKVYNFIHKIGLRKNILLSATDNDKNNVLHLAAKLGPPTSSRGPVLHFQRELQWYQEVEQVVPPLYKTMPNSYNQTPKQLFTEEHEKLVEKAEDWIKKTAESCSTVSSLITTVAFAGAFTLPGGNKDDGTPVYLHDLSFLIFSISNALALFASATAVLMFLSILTSRYLEEDFLKTLPKRMIIGLSSLFLSITFMLAAFCSALHIALVHRLEWIVFPLIMLSLVPVAFYASSQGPLLFDMLYSTYGPSLFDRKLKEKCF